MIIGLTLCDVDDVTACYHNANELFAPTNRPNATRDDFLKIFSSDIILGYRDNGLKGFISYRIQNKTAFINSLYVDMSSGRKGIGTALVNEVLGIVEEKGVQTCIVDCLKNSDWALSFYRKLCFREYIINESEIDDIDALQYLKSKENHIWSIRMYKLIFPKTK